ncbi:hypothetical protein CRENBAI_017719 [Crenichthys baileyi]|uniref:Uncharacterized protein n=1 Tax=Crenichthys baileyi TaxID=28760 RepID=A0AAV9R5U1_9TELE
MLYAGFVCESGVERHGSHCRLCLRLDQLQGKLFPFEPFRDTPQMGVISPLILKACQLSLVTPDMDSTEGTGEKKPGPDACVSVKLVMYKSQVITRGQRLRNNHWMVPLRGPAWLEERGFIWQLDLWRGSHILCD